MLNKKWECPVARHNLLRSGWGSGDMNKKGHCMLGQRMEKKVQFHAIMPSKDEKGPCTKCQRSKSLAIT